MDSDNNSKALLSNYRRENLLLNDKLHNIEENLVVDLKEEIKLLKEELDKKNDAVSYWRHKYNKSTNYSWFY